MFRGSQLYDIARKERSDTAKRNDKEKARKKAIEKAKKKQIKDEPYQNFRKRMLEKIDKIKSKNFIERDAQRGYYKIGIYRIKRGNIDVHVKAFEDETLHMKRFITETEYGVKLPIKYKYETGVLYDLEVPILVIYSSIYFSWKKRPRASSSDYHRKLYDITHNVIKNREKRIAEENKRQKDIEEDEYQTFRQKMEEEKTKKINCIGHAAELGHFEYEIYKITIKTYDNRREKNEFQKNTAYMKRYVKQHKSYLKIPIKFKSYKDKKSAESGSYIYFSWKKRWYYSLILKLGGLF